MFYRDIENSLKYLIVQEDVKLVDINNQVKVIEVGKDPHENMFVPVGNLLKDDGMIATIPSHLYSISDDSHVTFEDIIIDFIVKLDIRDTVDCYSDNDWVDVLMVNCNTERQKYNSCISPITLTSIDGIGPSGQKRKEMSRASSGIRSKVQRAEETLYNQRIEECWVSLLSPSYNHMIDKWVACIYIWTINKE